MKQENTLKIPNKLTILNLGKKHYLPVWTLQKELQQKLINGTGKPTLIFCEHEPVITLGRSASRDNILISEEKLKTLGIEVYEIERGGDVTWHGPGQLVCYPIIDLKEKKKDVHWYMRNLEEVIIQVLLKHNIKGERIEGKTGVWVKSKNEEYKKIAAIGVRISRWCTLHGFSINIEKSDESFSLINPCGYSDIKVTSFQEEGSVETKMDCIQKEIVNYFTKIFQYN